MHNLRPAAIRADRQKKEFKIRWSDDVDCVIPFSLMRHACPCAECRGGHENMKSDPDPGVFALPLVDSRATKVRRVDPVGNYAISIEWEDGHHFGIYNWQYLRALCDQAGAQQD